MHSNLRYGRQQKEKLMKSTLRTLDDGTIEITVVEGGMVEMGWVSSMHLTETKINQLKAVIARKSAAAFFERSKDISDE
mgnify:CR=1 FL=1